MGDQQREYDVALSFASEDRAYVEGVASALKSMGVRVFYDKYEAVNLWGKDLYTRLRQVYFQQASYTVMFISKYYKDKLWTNHERESAQARAFSDRQEYILPARFDATEIPGVLPTIGYINLKDYSPKEFAELIRQKISVDPGRTFTIEKSYPEKSESAHREILPGTQHVDSVTEQQGLRNQLYALAQSLFELREKINRIAYDEGGYSPDDDWENDERGEFDEKEQEYLALLEDYKSKYKDKYDPLSDLIKYRY